MAALVTWKKDIQPMLNAWGEIPDMLDIGINLNDYQFVAANFELLRARVADGSMPPGVPDDRIDFIEKWIDNNARPEHYAKVQDILDRAVGGPTAPVGAHGAFWRGVTRDQFVSNSVFGVQLIEMNNGAASNLVKALKGEAPFDGAPAPGHYRRMPDRFWWTDDVRRQNIELFDQWKVDGFLEDEEKEISVTTRFNDVVTILDTAVGGPTAPVGAHGAFWRGVTLDQFVSNSVFGVQLIEMNNGAESNLVKALKGTLAGYPQMPAGRPPLRDEDINAIQIWIDNGCPA